MSAGVAPRVPRGNRGVLAVVLVAILARLTILAPLAGRPMDDPDNYLEIARSLWRGEGYRLQGRPTAYRPPLYPLLLAPVVGPAGRSPFLGVAGLHLLLGAATGALTWRTARLWGLSEPRALAAGLVVALDPVLLAQARWPMTETLSAATIGLALLGLSASTPLRASVFGGLGLGLAALCRPSVLPGAGLIAVAMAVQGAGSGLRRLSRSMLLLLAMAMLLMPWAARNTRVFGEPVWTTTHGGYTLALANNAAYYDEVVHGPPGAVWGGARQDAWWTDLNRRTAGQLEPAADRELRRLAVATIRERPGDFARASLSRLGRFWGLAPSSRVYSARQRLATAAWTIPLWLALGTGLLRRDAWRWPRIAAPALLVGLTCVHAVFWADLRMRAPLVPAVALVAGSAGAPRRDPGEPPV